ncbi:N-acetylglucosaminyl-phosphatidylinositol de-N-acetylase [Hypocenomyce scalaris]|nr:N-acetylglucosaminyl-phosphatidylinositol de-N-acetylase [Hypocenomyce scalaris]
MSLFIYTAIPIVLTTLWLYTVHMTRSAFPQLRNKRICLLIAHPDDEAMFFAPTLLALTDQEAGNHVKILCLSNGVSQRFPDPFTTRPQIPSYSPLGLNWQKWYKFHILVLTRYSSGNADGLGPTRTKELTTSALQLGLRSPTDILVLDTPDFPDSMTTIWSAATIAKVLSSAFSPSTHSQRSSEGPAASIDALITFDSHGVSGHLNHRSLPAGALNWLQGVMRDKNGWECPVALYTLSSTNILRKYVSIFDAPFTMLRFVLGGARGASAGKNKGAGWEERAPQRLMFLSDVWQWRRAQKAMTQGHKSQMRWFRWGWVGVGRFMVVNDLRREKIHGRTIQT